MEKLIQHDLFMFDNFGISMNLREFHSKIVKYFSCFVVTLFLSYVLIIKESWIQVNILLSVVIYFALCHLVAIKLILLLIFVVAIEQRLKLMRKLERTLNQQNFDANQLKTALMQILELIELTNDYFKPCFVQLMTTIYFCLVTNFYWISLGIVSFLSPPVLIESLICFIAPNIIILLILADRDRKLKRTLVEIIATFATSKCQLKEDLLLFLLRKQFSFSAFKLVNIGYATFGKVRTFKNFLTVNSNLD